MIPDLGATIYWWKNFICFWIFGALAHSSSVSLVTLFCFALDFFCITLCRSIRPEMFCEKGALKTYSIFIGKHLCWNLFFIKLFLDFKPSKVPFMIQKRLCSLSTQVKWHFYQMVKIHHNDKKWKCFDHIWTFTLKCHENLLSVQ